MDYTGRHRVFIVETFIKNESATRTRSAFRSHFRLSRHDLVPTRNTISLWATNFRGTGPELQKNQLAGCRPPELRKPSKQQIFQFHALHSYRHSNMPPLFTFPLEV